VLRFLEYKKADDVRVAYVDGSRLHALYLRNLISNTLYVAILQVDVQKACSKAQSLVI
jgi:hypothetical protein